MFCAINANLVEVKLSQDAPAGLAKENIEISNNVNVEKLVVSGKTLTLTTSTMPANKDLTMTFKDVAELDKATATFKYNQAVNLETAIEGFVFVPKLDANGEVIADTFVKAQEATVTLANGVTTKTDANGYYKLPAEVGTVEVKIEAKGHYVSTKDVVVAAKKATAHVVNLELVDSDMLKIEGAVKDSKTGAAVVGAIVKLEEKVDSKWKLIDQIDTNTNSEFAFLNSKAVVTVSPFTPEAKQFTDIFGERTNKIKQGTEYRIVAEKDSGAVVAEANRPYHEATVEFKLSEDSSRTFEPVAMKAVKEIKKIDVDFTYGARFADVADLGKNVKLTLIDTDGKTNIGNEITVSDLELDKNPETAVNTGKINLVDKISGNAYLKTGTYYLRVDDDKDELATQVVPVKVTEGTNSTGTKVEAKKAEKAELTSQFKYIPADIASADVSADNSVDAEVNVYKTIGDVDVLVKTDTLTYALDDTGDTKKLEGSVTLAKLAAEGYKVTLDHKYILGTPSINITPKSGSVIQPNLPVDGGGTLAVETNLVDKEGTAITSDNLAGTIVNTDIELTDDKGNKETYSIPLVFKSVAGSKGKVDVDATNLALKLAGKNVVVAQDDTTESKLTFTFTKLKEAKYTAKFTSDEFKTNTSKETKVEMFKEAKVTGDDVVKLEMTPSIELAGSLTFGATKENAKAVAVKVYDMNGKTEEELKGARVSSTLNTAGKYSITLDKAAAGKYKVVFYGSNMTAVNDEAENQFETVEKIFDLDKGENFEHVEVVKGGQGKLEFNVFDENGNRLSDSEVTVEVTDKYDTDVTLETLTDGETASKVALSKGDYTVKVTPVNLAVHKPVVQTVTLDRVNGTVLTTINVELVNKGKTFDVSGKVLDSNGTGVEGAEVAVFDATTGEFVTNVETDGSGGTAGEYATKLSNGGYVIKAYKDGNFVASVEIEVKDRALTDVNMTTKVATR